MQNALVMVLIEEQHALVAQNFRPDQPSMAWIIRRQRIADGQIGNRAILVGDNRESVFVGLIALLR